MSDDHRHAAELALFNTMPEWVKTRIKDDPAVTRCLRLASQHGSNRRAVFFEELANAKAQSSDSLYKDYFEHLQMCPYTIGNVQRLTVATETGLTPRQLTEVNRELVEALEKLLVQFEINLPASGIVHDETMALIDAKSALARAKGAK